MAESVKEGVEILEQGKDSWEQEETKGLEESTTEVTEPKVSDEDLKLIEEVDGKETADEEGKEDKEEPKVEEPPKGEDEDLQLRPTLNQINTKYPNLFKDFPGLRHMYFREQKYQEAFPTVEEAVSAKEDLAGLEELERGLLTGKTEDVVSTFSTIKELGEDVLPNLAVNFLPALQKMDPNLYYTVTTPLLVDVVRSLYEAGLKIEQSGGNANLKNTGLAAAMHFFGDPEVATGKRTLNLPKAKITEETTDNKGKLDEKTKFMQERHMFLRDDIVSEYTSELQSKILEGLDPDNVMTDFTKNSIVDSIMKRIDKVLVADKAHMSRQESLWNKAASNGYSRDWKDRIKSAVLSRALSIMPVIRSRVRAEALGTKIKEGTRVENRANSSGEKRTPNSGAAPKVLSNPSMNQIARIDSKKIDWKKTSDMDLLQGRVHLK